MNHNKDFPINILMVLAMLTWGLSWTNAKIVGQYAEPQLIMIWRFFFASISLLPIMISYRISFKINKDTISLILLNSIFMVSYNFFYFKGTQVGFAGMGGVLVTTLNPILTTLFASIFLNKTLSKKDFIGLFIGTVGGSIILRFWDLEISSLIDSGSLFFLLASLSWVFVTINTSKLKNKKSYINYSFWSFIFSFLLCLIKSDKENIFIVFHFDWVFWINLILLATFAMSFGTSIFFLASVRLGPTKASTFIFLVPIAAMGFAIYFLSEPLYVSTVIGGILGMIAVYIINHN